MTISWPVACATGVGSWPGTASREAATVIAGELPELPHLQELPARGPGADIVGRTAGLLAQVDSGLAITTTPSGWRLAGGPTRDAQRALSYLGEDLDYAQEQFGDYSGTYKLQLCGPWTLAARIELPNGNLVLSDHGARADVQQALGAAAESHVAEVRRRLPHAQVLVQFDEPMLTQVHEARVPTPSGFATYRGVATAELTAGLGIARAGLTVPAGVHSCAPRFPVAEVQASGYAFISFDILAARPSDQLVSEAHDAGMGLIVGCVPIDVPSHASVEQMSRPVRRYLADLGLARTEYLDRVAVSPVCGLAGSATPRLTLSAVRSVSSVLKDLDGEEDAREMIHHG